MISRTDILDVVQGLLITPFIFVFVTRAPVLASFIFSCVLVAG